MKIINSYKGHQQIISDENRDRSPHSSPERHSQLVEEDIVSSSDDGIILTQEPIDLEFFDDSCSLSEDSRQSIQPPREPTCFFPR